MTIHQIRGAGAALPIPTDIVEDRRRLWDLRRAIEAELDRMIELLDALDGDPDLEPSLGAPEVLSRLCIWSQVDTGTSQLNWARGNSEDLEDEHDGTEPDDDREPDLGWANYGAQGRSGAQPVRRRA